jgi:hypothetical protein
MHFCFTRKIVTIACCAAIAVTASSAYLLAQDHGMAPANSMGGDHGMAPANSMGGDHGMMAGDKPMMAGPMSGDMMMSTMKSMKDVTAADLAKMMVMQKMAMQLCTDEKCMAMCKDDPAVAKSLADAAKMAADPKQMAAIADEISKDPAMMKMVVTASMAHMQMMQAGMTGGMGGNMMGGDHGMMGGHDMGGTTKPSGDMKPGGDMKPKM